jgi:methionine-gamma-lyase
LNKTHAPSSASLRTRAVHAGTTIDRITGAIGPSIETSVTFGSRYGDIGFSAAGTDESKVPFAYAREGHPTAQKLERRLTSLENGADCVVFSSGIAAISGLLLMVLNPGDHLVVSDVTYAGTAEFVRGFLRRKGIEVSFADMSDLADVKGAVQSRTKVIYAESPCNPLLKLADITALASFAHEAGVLLIIDSTFASPALTRPLDLGADFVVHSLTKYCGGHGDAVGGAVIGRSAAQVRELRLEIGTHLGATLSPFNAWLILRGIETLPIRMDAYARSARQVATFLQKHPFVTAVRYPGLASHPQYELACRQMANGSGMIAFTVQDMHRFGKVLEGSLKIFSFAASLGLSRSLILHCDTADLQRTTFQLDEAHLSRYRHFAGDGFFRLSIGLEDPEDLCADLGSALEAAASGSP